MTDGDTFLTVEEMLREHDRWLAGELRRIARERVSAEDTQLALRDLALVLERGPR
jgi:hypothetical protein